MTTAPGQGTRVTVDLGPDLAVCLHSTGLQSLQRTQVLLEVERHQQDELCALLHLDLLLVRA